MFFEIELLQESGVRFTPPSKKKVQLEKRSRQHL